MQETTVAVTRVDILNDITSKILGGALPWMSLLHKYWGDMSPCLIGIDACTHTFTGERGDGFHSDGRSRRWGGEAPKSLMPSMETTYVYMTFNSVAFGAF